jgi:hypothetical protein
LIDDQAATKARHHLQSPATAQDPDLLLEDPVLALEAGDQHGVPVLDVHHGDGIRRGEPVGVVERPEALGHGALAGGAAGDHEALAGVHHASEEHLCELCVAVGDQVPGLVGGDGADDVAEEEEGLVDVGGLLDGEWTGGGGVARLFQALGAGEVDKVDLGRLGGGPVAVAAVVAVTSVVAIVAIEEVDREDGVAAA